MLTLTNWPGLSSVPAGIDARTRTVSLSGSTTESMNVSSPCTRPVLLFGPATLPPVSISPFCPGSSAVISSIGTRNSTISCLRSINSANVPVMSTASPARAGTRMIVPDIGAVTWSRDSSVRALDNSSRAVSSLCCASLQQLFRCPLDQKQLFLALKIPLFELHRILSLLNSNLRYTAVETEQRISLIALLTFNAQCFTDNPRRRSRNANAGRGLSDAAHIRLNSSISQNMAAKCRPGDFSHINAHFGNNLILRFF